MVRFAKLFKLRFWLWASHWRTSVIARSASVNISWAILLMLLMYWMCSKRCRLPFILLESADRMYIFSLMVPSVTSLSTVLCCLAMSRVEQSQSLETVWRIWKLVRPLLCCYFVNNIFRYHIPNTNTIAYSERRVDGSLKAYSETHPPCSFLKYCLSVFKTYCFVELGLYEMLLQSR